MSTARKRETALHGDGAALGLCLVTGGAGFVGRRVVDLLLRAGAQVRVLDLAPDSVQQRGVDYQIGDICDPVVARAALAGVQTVLHTAAVVNVSPGPQPLLQKVNVEATRLLLAEAAEAGVKRFVHTSSMDVVFDGQPHAGADERLPYPTRPMNDYIRTKAVSEQEALTANGLKGMATCALRPTGIFGPDDNHRFRPVFAAARAGTLKRALGDGSGRYDHVFVDNVASGLIQAARALHPGAAHAGRAYFITDEDATNFFAFMSEMLVAGGLPPLEGHQGTGALLPLLDLAQLLRRAASALGLGWEMTLTRYSVLSITIDFFFTHAAATRDFGYQPLVTHAEGRARTKAWLAQAKL